MTAVYIGFSSSKDFIEKLKREIARLHDAQHFDDTDENILDHGLNASITAWHLHEVIAKEYNLQIKDYREDIKKRHSDLGVLHDIATQAKHFQVNAPKRDNPHDTLEIKTNVRLWQTKEEWDEGEEAMKSFGIVFTNQEYKARPLRALRIEDRDLEEILEEARFFWEREIKSLSAGNLSPSLISRV
jgi:hypothetical protein